VAVGSGRLVLGLLVIALDALADTWRARAAELRAWGAGANAETLERAAAELEEAIAAGATELLSLEDAAELSGYTADHLGRLVRLGRIPNRGRPNAPRIQRSDVPAKPCRRARGNDDARSSTSLSAISREAIMGRLPRSRR
jgi:hypothetical protein